MLAVESESIRHGQIRPRPSPSRTSHQHRVCFDDVDMSLVDETHVQTCFVSSQDIIGATETGYLLTFSSTRRWNGVRSETRPRALPPTADEVRVLPTGRSRFRRCVALLEREEASSADAVGRARAKMGALDRMRRTQFKSCSMVSTV